MELFKKACDLGHERGCLQYESFKSRIGALDLQAQGVSPTENTVEALAERIRQTYTCASVVKSARQPSEPGITVWNVECSGNHLYTVIVGMRGESTVIQKSK